MELLGLGVEHADLVGAELREGEPPPLPSYALAAAGMQR